MDHHILEMRAKFEELFDCSKDARLFFSPGRAAGRCGAGASFCPVPPGVGRLLPRLSGGPDGTVMPL